MNSTLTTSHQASPMSRTTPLWLRTPITLAILAAVSLVKIDYPIAQ